HKSFADVVEPCRKVTRPWPIDVARLESKEAAPALVDQTIAICEGLRPRNVATGDCQRLRQPSSPDEAAETPRIRAARGGIRRIPGWIAPRRSRERYGAAGPLADRVDDQWQASLPHVSDRMKRSRDIFRLQDIRQAVTVCVGHHAEAVPAREIDT